MCDLKYMDKKNTHNLFKITNISLLLRSFVNVKRRVCCFVYIYLYICTSISIYLYTAHIVFIHIPSVAVKPVHIFMVRNRVCKTCLMAELCFHCFVHFDCISIFWYTFPVITARSVLAIRSTSLLWCSPLSCSVLLMSP